MKRYIYNRVSSEQQDYLQQQKCVNDYFARTGIDPASIDGIVTEKISGTVSHEERKLGDLLRICKSGDTVYVSELSRIGRCMSDVFAIVTECCNKGVTIIQCKDGTNIENSSIGGKALLFALSLAAEIEVANIRQRTQMSLDARKEMLRKEGQFISKSGRVCTHLGNEKGCDTSAAAAARGMQLQSNAIVWRENSKGYNAVRRWVSEGWSNEQIIKEFNALHEADPQNYSTYKGGRLTPSLARKWRWEIGKGII